MNRFSPLLLAVSVATGCASEAPRSPQATVVDSAGARIVSHGSTGAGERAVAGEPELAIGRGPDAAIDLYRVRGGVLLHLVRDGAGRGASDRDSKAGA